MERKEAKAELKEVNGERAEGEEEEDGARPEGEEDGAIEVIGAEGFQGTSTGLWWGNSEDGEALLDLCARLIIHLVFKAETEHGGIFDDKGQSGSILTFLPGWA